MLACSVSTLTMLIGVSEGSRIDSFPANSTSSSVPLLFVKEHHPTGHPLQKTPFGKISKVSATVYVRYRASLESTFENVSLCAVEPLAVWEYEKAMTVKPSSTPRTLIRAAIEIMPATIAMF